MCLNIARDFGPLDLLELLNIRMVLQHLSGGKSCGIPGPAAFSKNLLMRLSVHLKIVKKHLETIYF